MDKKQLAKDYFNRHTTNNECFITSDNRVFHTRGAAESHAGTLKDQAIETHAREDYSGTSTEDAQELLKNFNPESKTAYEDGKAIVKAFDLKTVSNKKDDVLAAVAAYIDSNKG